MNGRPVPRCGCSGSRRSKPGPMDRQLRSPRLYQDVRVGSPPAIKSRSECWRQCCSGLGGDGITRRARVRVVDGAIRRLTHIHQLRDFSMILTASKRDAIAAACAANCWPTLRMRPQPRPKVLSDRASGAIALARRYPRAGQLVVTSLAPPEVASPSFEDIGRPHQCVARSRCPYPRSCAATASADGGCPAHRPDDKMLEAGAMVSLG